MTQILISNDTVLQAICTHPGWGTALLAGAMGYYPNDDRALHAILRVARRLEKKGCVRFEWVRKGYIRFWRFFPVDKTEALHDISV